MFNYYRCCCIELLGITCFFLKCWATYHHCDSIHQMVAIDAVTMAIALFSRSPSHQVLKKHAQNQCIDLHSFQQSLILCFSTLQSLTGWWFGTFSIFPYICNNHPN